MSFKTQVMNLRASLKAVQMRTNAEQAVQTRSHTSRASMFGIPFALAFVFSLAVFTMPAQAATLDLNATIAPILNGVANLIPAIVDLIVAVVPAIIVLAVVGFIVAFLDKILAMLKF